MVDRELRMIELKKEVNELCQRQSEAPRYPLEFEREGTDATGTVPFPEGGVSPSAAWKSGTSVKR